jgi:hypothetical protein
MLRVLKRKVDMSREWDRIANQEFKSMDQGAQQDWAELRKKVEEG